MIRVGCGKLLVSGGLSLVSDLLEHLVGVLVCGEEIGLVIQLFHANHLLPEGGVQVERHWIGGPDSVSN